LVPVDCLCIASRVSPGTGKRPIEPRSAMLARLAKEHRLLRALGSTHTPKDAHTPRQTQTRVASTGDLVHHSAVEIRWTTASCNSVVRFVWPWPHLQSSSVRRRQGKWTPRLCENMAEVAHLSPSLQCPGNAMLCNVPSGAPAEAAQHLPANLGCTRTQVNSFELLMWMRMVQFARWAFGSLPLLLPHSSLGLRCMIV